jgi:RNA polymerase-binding transcription factor DksA
MGDQEYKNEGKYADLIDQANHLAEIHTEYSVDRARQKAAPEQTPNEDGTWPEAECRDCGEPIEPVRLEMGRVRCFQCQEDKEKRAKRGLV